MSFNIEYVGDALCPFGNMTKDMMALLKHMKTEKFICVQTLGRQDSIYVLRGQESEDDYGVSLENVMAISNHHIKDKEVVISTGKNYKELAHDIDRQVVKYLLRFGEDCEVLGYNHREGLSPCIRSAGIALSSKLLRLSRMAVLANRDTVKRVLATVNPNILTLATDVDHMLVFNAGTNSFDGGVFFVPLSLDKRNGQISLQYMIVCDDVPRNFMKLIEDTQVQEELTLDHDLDEKEFMPKRL